MRIEIHVTEAAPEDIGRGPVLELDEPDRRRSKLVIREKCLKLSLGDERHNYGRARKAMRLRIRYEGSRRSYVEGLGYSPLQSP